MIRGCDPNDFLDFSCPFCMKGNRISKEEISASTASKTDLKIECFFCSKIWSFEGEEKAPTSDSTCEASSCLLYDILQVPRDADEAQIKKSYRLLAMKYHPDRHPEDPKAEEKFKRINEAYKILGDQRMRQKYDLGLFDKENSTELSTNNMAGMEEFFKQTFGGEAFVDLIGEISLARLIEDVMGAGTGAGTGTSGSSSDQILDGKKEENERLQEERVKHLYEKLLRKIEPFMEDSETLDQLKSRVGEEIFYLKGESYGPELLQSIGYIYVARANQALAKGTFLGIPAMFQGLKEKGHMVSEFIATISAFREMMKVVEQEQKRSEEKNSSETSDDNGANKFSSAENHEKNDAIMKKAMWKASNLDIEHTLRDVCDRIFIAVPSNDGTNCCKVDSETRKKRAMAIKAIGEIYMKSKQEV